MTYTHEDFAEIEQKWIVKGRPRCAHTNLWAPIGVGGASEEGCTACGLIRRENETVEVRGVWS